MLAALITAVLTPWLTPLTFASHPTGWHTGSSGTYVLTVGRERSGYPVSVAWAATIRCPDCNRSNPPNATLRHLRPGDIVVWAEHPARRPHRWPPAGRRLGPGLTLSQSFRFPCWRRGAWSWAAPGSCTGSAR